MSAEPIVFDIADAPELQRVLDEARERSVAVIIRDGGRDVAALTPFVLESTAQAMIGVLTKEQYELAMSAAGSWGEDFDLDAWLEETYASRGQKERDLLP